MAKRKCKLRCEMAYKKNRAYELADNHWFYIRNLLEVSGVQKQEIERIGFHYISAMVHGYGHGKEDATNGNT